MNLPKWYIEWVERVSNIVSFHYPFDWNSKMRYLNWLKWHGISNAEYMKEAQDTGTFVHLQLEKYLLWKPLDTSNGLFNLHKNEIEFWTKYIKDLFLLREGDILTEQVVIDNKKRFQWTIDLVRIDEKTKTVRIYDWKTWGIAKKRWGLKNEIKKNSDKLKKVALQLSLYAETYRQKWYKVWWIYVLWLHNEELVEWNLFAEFHRQKVKNIRLWTTDELENLLARFSFKDRLPPDFNLIIKDKMIIEVQTPIPNNPYSQASVIIQENDMEGKTPEEKIGEAIKLQKLLLSKY